MKTVIIILGIILGITYKVKIEITQQYLGVYFNNTLINEMEKDIHVIGESKQIWLSNPNYIATNVTISDFVVETFDNKAGYILSSCNISNLDLVLWYKASDFIINNTLSINTLKWLDNSGKGNHITKSNVCGTILKDSTYNYIYGNISSSIAINYDVNPYTYTIFHVSRYNGISKGRISYFN